MNVHRLDGPKPEKSIPGPGPEESIHGPGSEEGIDGHGIRERYGDGYANWILVNFRDSGCRISPNKTPAADTSADAAEMG